jgi:hypothetical protein
VIDLSAMRGVFTSFDAMVRQGRIEDDGAGNTILHLDAKNPASDATR